MQIDRALEWLQSTPIAVTVAENDILFPWIESVHVLAIVLVVGTISIVDLRLLGMASLDISARRHVQLGVCVEAREAHLAFNPIQRSLSARLESVPGVFRCGCNGPEA